MLSLFSRRASRPPFIQRVRNQTPRNEDILEQSSPLTPPAGMQAYVQSRSITGVLEDSILGTANDIVPELKETACTEGNVSRAPASAPGDLENIAGRLIIDCGEAVTGGCC